MTRQNLEYIVLWAALVLLQVLLFNHLVLFNIAVPFVFIYFIVRLPLALSMNWQLTLAFITGFVIDVFSDTPGINALACVIICGIRKTVLFSFVKKDDKMIKIIPTVKTLGIWSYSKYLLSISVIFSLLYFGIEYFSIIFVKEIIINSLSSAVLTFTLLLGIDSLLSSNEKRL